MDYQKALELNIGDTVYFNVDDFDCPKPKSIKCTVTKKKAFGVVAESDGVDYLICAETADLFSLTPAYQVAK